jgi:hypothetical protein
MISDALSEWVTILFGCGEVVVAGIWKELLHFRQRTLLPTKATLPVKPAWQVGHLTLM